MWRSTAGQKSRDFVTEAQAKRWQALLDALGEQRALAEMARAAPAETTLTVAEQVGEHIDQLTGVTEGTRKVYRSHLQRVIAPSALGSVPLPMLRREDVAAWVNQLEAQGCAAKTIANYHGLLSAALTTAVLKGLIGNNPSHKMRLPRTDHKAVEHVYLTPEQYLSLHAAMTEHYRPLILLLVGTGMRFGEATALRWRDVDLSRCEARISRAWQYTGKAARVIGSPKTSRSNRTVTMAKEAAGALDTLPHGQPDDYVLLAPRGGPIRQSVFYPHWRDAAQSLDLTPAPRIHDLRHTWASWAIQDRHPLPAIQRQLGHESIQTTVDTYGHLARSDFDALAHTTSVRLAGALPAISA